MFAKRILLVVFLSILSLGLLATEKYPAAVFERPFTMPQNSFESSIRFDKGNVFQLGTIYGITDHTEIGLFWNGFGTAKAMPEQAISLALAQFLFSTKHVSSMATLSVPFHFEQMVLNKVSLGLPTYVPIVRGKLNLVFLEDIATLQWKESTFAEFAFHVRLSWQATHSLCLSLVTTPGTLSTAGNHTHLIDVSPISLKALYAITPMFDVVGEAGFKNILQAKDNVVMMLGVSFRGGDIEG